MPPRREALEVFQTAAAEFPKEMFLQQELAHSHRLLASVLGALSKLEEAERHYRKAIALERRCSVHSSRRCAGNPTYLSIFKCPL